MGGVASSIAALGNGTQDGDLGIIRVTQDGETWEVKLFWDAVNSKWVSAPLDQSIWMDDSDWSSNMQQSAAPTWQYFGGTESALSHWSLRSGAIQFAGALFAAGLKLQDRAVGRILDPGASAKVYVAPWFYEFTSGDALSLDNDQSTFAGDTWNGVSTAAFGFLPSTGNIGHGVVLASDGTGTAKIFDAGAYEDNIVSGGYHGVARSAGWDYVKFFTSTTLSGTALGGVPTTTPHTPTKKFLYPTLYGYGCSNGSNGVAAYTWECRWSS